jgi:hypothetical protein
MELDKVTPHACKQQQIELIQTPIQKRIDELAVQRTEAFERISAALEKNNQNDALFLIGEGLMEIAKAIRTLAPPGAEAKEMLK